MKVEETKPIVKKDILLNLRNLTDYQDDDNIRIKSRIKDRLISCPELLYAIHNKELEEAELFLPDGTINYDGEWDRYFGVSGHIRDYVYMPQTQTESSNYICYKVDSTSTPRGNDYEKYGTVTFIIFCEGKNVYDKETGIPRHDLIASIIKDRFNWSSIFGSQCVLTSEKEGLTDTNFVTRTLVFTLVLPKNPVKTIDGKSLFVRNGVLVK